MNEIIKQRIQESINVKNELIFDENTLSLIDRLSNEIVNCLKSGKKIILCGNGGSASDALHFAGEIVGRFQKDRDAWPALVLNSDISTITSIANDYGYDEVFARQAKCHCNTGDVFIGISTSGNSENVLRAVEISKKKGVVTAALLGKDGGRIREKVDYPIIIPSTVTARIQECHILIIHIICEIIEEKMR